MAEQDHVYLEYKGKRLVRCGSEHEIEVTLG